MYKINTLAEIKAKFECSIEQDDNCSSLKTEYKIIDETLNGLQTRQLYFLGARPGVGKTTLTVNLINNISKNLNSNEYILLFSLEMSKIDIYKKLLVLNSGLTWETISNYFASNFTEDQKLLIENANQQLMTKNILIFDNEDEIKISPEIINQILQQLKSENKVVKAIFIDYFQLLDTEQNFSLEHEKYSSFSKKLKSLAKKQNINVFVLTQLSRDIDKRKFNTPTFADLKGTSSIEQDADVVMFLYDEDMQQSLEIKRLNLLIAKNRNGKINKQNISFYSNLGLFVETGDLND